MSGIFGGMPMENAGEWVTKSDRAHGAVRQAILAGKLMPKQQINPKLVATELNMSIIPVREALRRLEQEGLVVIKPHVGAAVREMPVAEITENLLIRSTLEALATELAAPLMTPEIIEKLRDLVAQMGTCIETGELGEFGELNRAFHFAIYDVIAEKGLVKLIEHQWDQIPQGASVFSLVPEHSVIAHKEHQELVEALSRKDAATAARLTREHKLRARVVHGEAFNDVREREMEAAV